MEKRKLWYLNTDNIMYEFPISTKYDIGERGHEIIVEEEELDHAIEGIVSEFEAFLRSYFEPYDEEEDEY